MPAEIIEAHVKHVMSQPNVCQAQRKEADEALAVREVETQQGMLRDLADISGGGGAHKCAAVCRRTLDNACASKNALWLGPSW
jgi:hypothetical protein